MEIPEEAFSLILKELDRRPLELNRYRKRVGDGRSQVFGVVGRRSLPPDYSRQCWRRPYLYKLLLDFASQYVSIPYNAITLNHNYTAGRHRDKHNTGKSLVVAFGDYSGGELVIYNGEKKGEHNVRHKPIIEDFSVCEHEVKEFRGTRCSLVFYTFKSPKWPEVSLPPPSVKQENGEWLFYRGDSVCKSLPHFLSGRKLKPPTLNQERKEVEITFG